MGFVIEKIFFYNFPIYKSHFITEVYDLSTENFTITIQGDSEGYVTFECPYYYLLMIVIFAAIVLLYWEEIVSAVKGGYRFLKCKGGKV